MVFAVFIFYIYNCFPHGPHVAFYLTLSVTFVGVLILLAIDMAYEGMSYFDTLETTIFIKIIIT
jgi:hypothetical protein